MKIDLNLLFRPNKKYTVSGNTATLALKKLQVRSDPTFLAPFWNKYNILLVTLLPHPSEYNNSTFIYLLSSCLRLVLDWKLDQFKCITGPRRFGSAYTKYEWQNEKTIINPPPTQPFFGHVYTGNWVLFCLAFFFLLSYCSCHLFLCTHWVWYLLLGLKKSLFLEQLVIFIVSGYTWV